MANWKETLDASMGTIGTLANGNSGIIEALGVLGKATSSKGALDEKTRELISLAVAATTRCEGCISVHADAAVKAGASRDELLETLALVDGVMVGREAYHNPWWLTTWDEQFFGAAPFALSHHEIEAQMVAYMQREAAEHGTHWYAIARHMLGLRHGLPGARHWRQVWSNHRDRKSVV